MIVELKKKFQCKELIEELDKLIEEAVSLFDDFSGCRVSGYNVQKIKRFETILLSYLLEKTNFGSAFDTIRTSYGNIQSIFHTIIYNLICQIGQKNLDPTFNNFLTLLDAKIRSLKRRLSKKYGFYIPSLFEFDLNNTDLKKLRTKIRESTGVAIKKPPKKILEKVKSNNYKVFLSNRQVILKVDVKARDHFYPLKIIDRELYALAGAIALSNHLYKDSEKWASRPGELSIAKNPIEDDLMIVEDNNKIIYPYPSTWATLDYEIKKEITLIGKEIWKIHNNSGGNYKRLITILGLLAKQNKKIKQLSKDSLKLYLEAITEKQLEISFLKFWIIAERILKQGGKRNDDSLLKLLKKIIKGKHLKGLIDTLYAKRNDLVHEFKTNFISQQDRNLAKMLAEVTLLFLIDPPTKINNLHELRFVIENILCPKKELILRKNILNRLVKKK